MKIVFATRDLELIARAFGRYPDLSRKVLRQFLTGATHYLKGEVIERTPAAHGALRASIFDEVDSAGTLGVVGTSLAYAVPVELGSKPHMMPIEPLEQWVRVKLGLAQKEAKAAARRIQWHIAHYGTPAAGMFHRGFTAGAAEVERQFGLAMERLRDLLAGAAP